MSTRLHSLSGLWYTLPLWHYGLFLLKAPVKCQADQSIIIIMWQRYQGLAERLQIMPSLTKYDLRRHLKTTSDKL